jgi:hypothetical protein
MTELVLMMLFQLCKSYGVEENFGEAIDKNFTVTGRGLFQCNITELTLRDGKTA